MSFKGINTIRLNQASIQYALQLWANSAFEHAPHVTAVKYDPNDAKFIITVSEEPENPA